MAAHPQGKTTRSAVVRFTMGLILAMLLGVSPAALSSQVTLRWQSRDTPLSTEADVNAILVQNFQQRHPHIRVEVELSGGADIQVQLLSGVAPDVLDRAGDIIDLGRNGLLLDLTPYMDVLMPGDDRYDFNPSQMEAFQHHGIQFAVPKYLGVIGLWYNPELFERAGVEFPDESWTWSTLRTEGRKLSVADHGTGMLRQAAFIKSHGFDRIGCWILANGGRYYLDNDISQSAFHEPEAIEALQFLADLRHQFQVWAGPEWSRDHFIAGSGALLEDGVWYYQRMVAAGIDFTPKIAHMPRGPARRATLATIDGYAVAYHTQHPEEAIQFLRYLISPEANLIRAKYYGRQPARRSTLGEWTQMMNELLPGLDGDIVAEIGTYAYSQPLYSDPQLASSMISAAWRRIFVDNEPAAIVMNEVIPALNAQLRASQGQR